MRHFRTLAGLVVATALFAQQKAEEPKVLATLRYVDLQVGTGAPAVPGRRFTVHYTGWLKDGTKFDSSRDRDEPFRFVQGRKQVITGWDIGFEGMRVGGKRRLIIPYQLAYGEQGSGPIPPKGELTFDVELLAVGHAPSTLPAIDVLLPYRDLATRVTSLATPDRLKDEALLSILRRIIFLNTEYLNAITKDDPALSEIDLNKVPDSPVEPAQIGLELRRSFEEVQKEMESARNGSLGADAIFLGQNTTRRGLFTELVAAVAEQFGRANSIP